jgi:hypothetical protein
LTITGTALETNLEILRVWIPNDPTSGYLAGGHYEVWSRDLSTNRETALTRSATGKMFPVISQTDRESRSPRREGRR